MRRLRQRDFQQAALTLKAATSITSAARRLRMSVRGRTRSFCCCRRPATGTLTYQWQKNGVNLTNGGHYSGCTTATLTVTERRR